MNPYTHLTMNERETIFLMYEQGETIGHISETLDRSKSTISRELHRNSNKDGSYSPQLLMESINVENNYVADIAR